MRVRLFIHSLVRPLPCSPACSTPALPLAHLLVCCCLLLCSPIQVRTFSPLARLFTREAFHLTLNSFVSLLTCPLTRLCIYSSAVQAHRSTYPRARVRSPLSSRLSVVFTVTANNLVPELAISGSTRTHLQPTVLAHGCLASALVESGSECSKIGRTEFIGPAETLTYLC